LAIITALKGMQPDPLAVMRQAKDLFSPVEHGQEPPRNPIAELDQILGFAQKLASIRTPNSGDRSGWEVGLDYVKELGGPLIQTVNNFMALRSQAQRGAMPPAPGSSPVAPTAFDPYSNPELLRQHARAMNNQPAATATPPQGNQGSTAWAAAAAASTASGNAAQAPAGGTSGSQGQAGQGQALNEIGALLGQFGGLALNALNSGVSGAEFGDNLSRVFGTGMIAGIGNYGEDALTQAMLSMPEFAHFGENRIRRFTHEFVNFEEVTLADSDDVDSESERAEASA
jgi:hypothetical protein